MDGTQDHIELEALAATVWILHLLLKRIGDVRNSGPHPTGGYNTHCVDPAPVTKEDRRWMGLTITTTGGSDSCHVDPSPVIIMGDGW
jgi:hypothetical protein